MVLYALLVSAPVQSHLRIFDLRGCMNPHVLWALALVLSGTLGALPVAERALRNGLGASVAKVLPGLGREERRGSVRSAAALLIGLGMAVGFLWLVPGVDRFTDRNRALSAEADFLLYAMGILTGGAWSLLLGRLAWVGLPLTAALGSMWAALSFAPKSWC